MKNNKNSGQSRVPRNPAYPCAAPRPRISLTARNIPPVKLPKPAREAQFSKVAAENNPLPRKFLIAIPLLEFPPTHTKQNPLTFSNRDYIAVFQFWAPRNYFKR